MLGSRLPLLSLSFRICKSGSIHQRLGLAWWLRAQVLESGLAGSESWLCHLPALGLSAINSILLSFGLPHLEDEHLNSASSRG